MQITLKAARVNAALTQKEVGDYVGVGRDTIASWEAGSTFPDVLSFKKLCELYKVSMDAVIFLPQRST